MYGFKLAVFFDCHSDCPPTTQTNTELIVGHHLPGRTIPGGMLVLNHSLYKEDIALSLQRQTHISGMLNSPFTYLRNVFFIFQGISSLASGHIFHQNKYGNSHTPMISAYVLLLGSTRFNKMAGWLAESYVSSQETPCKIELLCDEMWYIPKNHHLSQLVSHTLVSMLARTHGFCNKTVRMRIGGPCQISFHCIPDGSIILLVSASEGDRFQFGLAMGILI